MIKLLLAAVLLAGCGPAAPRVSQTVSGDGELNTQSFALSGDYAVAWQADTDLDTGCYLDLTLQPSSIGIVTRVFDKAGPTKGETVIRGLASQSYYVVSASFCRWSLTFTPQ